MPVHAVFMSWQQVQAVHNIFAEMLESCPCLVYMALPLAQRPTVRLSYITRVYAVPFNGQLYYKACWPAQLSPRLLHPHINQAVVHVILLTVFCCCQVWSFIVEREVEAPERFQAIQSYRASMAVLRQQRLFIKQLFESGVVEDAERDELNRYAPLQQSDSRWACTCLVSSWTPAYVCLHMRSCWGMLHGCASMKSPAN